MKKFVYTLLIAIIGGVALSACGSSKSAAQKEAKAEEIQQKIDDFRFTFNATHAIPQGYKSIYLNSTYDLKVSKDSVQAYLPYYGRAYTAPMNPSEGGIMFTSTNFEYNVKQGKKKGNWKIDIKPKDISRDVQLSLDIWDNGSAQLNVSSSDRQSISFQGELE